MNVTKVNGEIFYHVCTNNHDFQIGDVIRSGKKLNPFYERFYKNNVEIWDERNYMHQCINYYWQFARETIFEEVRQKKFNSLPSRKKSLFLCDNSNVDYWRSVLNNDNKVLKLKLYGELLKVDSTFIDNIISLNTGYLPSFDYVEKFAKDYWSGHIVNSKKIEYLFYGSSFVEDVIS